MSNPSAPRGHVRPATSPGSGCLPWLLAGIAAVVEAAIVLVVVILVGISNQTCGQPVTSDVVLRGEVSFLVVALVAMTPWLLTCLWSRKRLMLGVYAAVAASPALFFVLVSTERSSWSGCLIQF